MGNKDSCCSCTPVQATIEHQIETITENKSEAKIDTQLKEKAEKELEQTIRLPNFSPFFLEKINMTTRKSLDENILMNSGCEQISQKIQSQKSSLCNQNQGEQQFEMRQKSSKVKNYISLKRSNPRSHYKFIKILFNSAAKKVYEVVNISNNNRKAIKVKKCKEKENEESANNKSESKIYLKDSLDHPNITRLYEVYQHQGSEYLVMELMQGDSLSKIPSCRQFKMANKSKSTDEYFDELKHIIQQILYALSYLHEREIAHLNIQRSNILLSHQFGMRNKVCAKLGSFYYSKDGITNKISRLPIQYYSNQKQKMFFPSEIMTKQGVCLKTDIWMFGICILQIITGNKFQNWQQRQNNSHFDDLRKLVQIEWKLLQKQLEFFQSHCLDLILKMIQIDASKRPSAVECLLHPWFLPLDLEQSDENLNRKSRSKLRQTVLEKKPNNLINYIENVIIYKNISQQELQQISEMFLKLDKNKNGAVQIQQIIQYFQNQYSSKQDGNGLQFCLQLINNLDSNASGTIDYHQFSKALVNKKKLITRQAIEEIFNHIDTDGNGKIVLNQLKNSLQGYDLSELEHYMKQIDTNFDGLLTKAEFIKYCLKEFQKIWHTQNQNSSQALPFVP